MSVYDSGLRVWGLRFQHFALGAVEFVLRVQAQQHVLCALSQRVCRPAALVHSISLGFMRRRTPSEASSRNLHKISAVCSNPQSRYQVSVRFTYK